MHDASRACCCCLDSSQLLAGCCHFANLAGKGRRPVFCVRQAPLFPCAALEPMDVARLVSFDAENEGG